LLAVAALATGLGLVLSSNDFVKFQKDLSDSFGIDSSIIVAAALPEPVAPAALSEPVAPECSIVALPPEPHVSFHRVKLPLISHRVSPCRIGYPIGYPTGYPIGYHMTRAHPMGYPYRVFQIPWNSIGYSNRDPY